MTETIYYEFKRLDHFHYWETVKGGRHVETSTDVTKAIKRE